MSISSLPPIDQIPENLVKYIRGNKLTEAEKIFKAFKDPAAKLKVDEALEKINHFKTFQCIFEGCNSDIVEAAAEEGPSSHSIHHQFDKKAKDSVTTLITIIKLYKQIKRLASSSSSKPIAPTNSLSAHVSAAIPEGEKKLEGFVTLRPKPPLPTPAPIVKTPSTSYLSKISSPLYVEIFPTPEKRMTLTEKFAPGLVDASAGDSLEDVRNVAQAILKELAKELHMQEAMFWHHYSQVFEILIDSYVTNFPRMSPTERRLEFNLKELADRPLEMESLFDLTNYRNLPILLVALDRLRSIYPTFSDFQDLFPSRGYPNEHLGSRNPRMLTLDYRSWPKDGFEGTGLIGNKIIRVHDVKLGAPYFHSDHTAPMREGFQADTEIFRASRCTILEHHFFEWIDRYRGFNKLQVLDFSYCFICMSLRTFAEKLTTHYPGVRMKVVFNHCVWINPVRASLELDLDKTLLGHEFIVFYGMGCIKRSLFGTSIKYSKLLPELKEEEEEAKGKEEAVSSEPVSAMPAPIESLPVPPGSWLILPIDKANMKLTQEFLGPILKADNLERLHPLAEKLMKELVRLAPYQGTRWYHCAQILEYVLHYYEGYFDTWGRSIMFDPNKITQPIDIGSIVKTEFWQHHLIPDLIMLLDRLARPISATTVPPMFTEELFPKRKIPYASKPEEMITLDQNSWPSSFGHQFGERGLLGNKVLRVHDAELGIPFLPSPRLKYIPTRDYRVTQAIGGPAVLEGFLAATQILQFSRCTIFPYNFFEKFDLARGFKELGILDLSYCFICMTPQTFSDLLTRHFPEKRIRVMVDNCEWLDLHNSIEYEGGYKIGNHEFIVEPNKEIPRMFIGRSIELSALLSVKRKEEGKGEEAHSLESSSSSAPTS